jgi:hypothetical protein
MAATLPRGSLYVISSPHGHDSFLIEIRQLNDAVAAWLNGTPVFRTPSGDCAAADASSGPEPTAER